MSGGTRDGLPDGAFGIVADDDPRSRLAAAIRPIITMLVASSFEDGDLEEATAAVEEVRATQSYRAIHEALAGALAEAGVPVILKPVAESAAGGEPGGPAGVCFERAEVFDVVHADTGAKIAGGAQKRNKRGLLFQGSLWRPAAGGAAVDWEGFGEEFVIRLSEALGADATPTPWPELNDLELEGLVEQYSSPDWMEFR